MRLYLRSELMAILDRDYWCVINGWLKRGDGVAVYENAALDSANAGHKQFVSFGSESAQLPGENPPQRMPDIGNKINWQYQLVGIYRGEQLHSGD